MSAVQDLTDILSNPFHGDWLTFAKLIPDKSVHTGITSPPYWGGVRDYSIDPIVWEPAPWHQTDVSNEGCEHDWGEAKKPPTKGGAQGNDDVGKRGHIPVLRSKDVKTALCIHCGAWLGQLGWEDDPDLFIWHIVLIMREVWRVLRDDGEFFLNMGDCYAGSGGSYGISEDTPSLAAGDKLLAHRIGYKDTDKWERRTNHDGMPRYPAKGDKSYSPMGNRPRNPTTRRPPKPSDYGLKPGDLVMVPHRLARALQLDGWTVRQDNVWTKKDAPTPEPVDDRTTRTHEFVFQLRKSSKMQFWTHRDLPGTRIKPKPDYRWIDRMVEKGMLTDVVDEEWKETAEETGIGDEKSRKARLRHFYDNSDKTVGGATVSFPALEYEQPPHDDWRNERILGSRLKRWKRINLWKGHKSFYDADAVRTAYKETTRKRVNYNVNKLGHEEGKLLKGSDPNTKIALKKGANHRSTLRFPEPLNIWDYVYQKVLGEDDPSLTMWLIDMYNEWVEAESVPTTIWDYATGGLKGAHFAVFPPEIPQFAIRAGSSARGVCPSCGAPWYRNVKKVANDSYGRDVIEDGGQHNDRHTGGYQHTETLEEDWRPTCDCGVDHTVPAIVLDPFGGSFTTAMVANEEGRDWLSCDMNDQYIDTIARYRVQVQSTSITDPKIKARDLDW